MRAIVKIWPVLASIPMIIIVGCATELTPMEIQAMQSREYEDDLVTVFNSVVTVFQDLGYSITAADRVTGFIAADGRSDSVVGSTIFGADVVATNAPTDATAFVESIGEITRVRISFAFMENSEYATTYPDGILDPQFYQDVFERVEQEIFVRS